jgi:DNA-3-methyladenine glycosylase II
MTAPDYWKSATRELAACDPVMAAMIKRYKGLALRSRGDAFQTLARSIVGQQISVKAAQTVWDRFAAHVGDVAPAAVLRWNAEDLRTCGLSGRKSGSLLDLADGFHRGTLRPEAWHVLPDEAVIAELTQVKGIGRWTAEMFLMFHLARPDVLPLDDVGLQRAMSLSYNRGRPLSRAGMVKFARPWAPWRSVATWYLWRSLEPAPVEY